MDQNERAFWKVREEALGKALKRNNMNLHVCESVEEAQHFFRNEVLKDGVSVTLGGSESLVQAGILKLCHECDIRLLDRWDPSLTPQERKEILRQGFFADVLLTGTNALTMSGELYNIDGNGNRVAQLAFGPDKVYVLAGVNKVFDDEASAISHVRNVASPANVVRVGAEKTGCRAAGRCVDCKLPNRICCSFLKTAFQRDPDRIHIVLVEDVLGY